VNFLEQLVAEWYEFNGYFVRRNVKVGPRERGGYECELDVVAFHPEKKHLVHVEPSTAADSWTEREAKFAKKFKAGRKYIPTLFGGLDIPAQIEQVALLGLGSNRERATIGGGRLVMISELMAHLAVRSRATLTPPAKSHSALISLGKIGIEGVVCRVQP